MRIYVAFYFGILGVNYGYLGVKTNWGFKTTILILSYIYAQKLNLIYIKFNLETNSMRRHAVYLHI